MEEFWLNLNGWQWHGWRWGQGSQLLVCFHGFGENANSFQVLEPALGADYTIVALDLPYHGLTQLQKHLSSATIDWQELMRCVLNKFHQTDYLLLGYSLGGRVCLQLAQLMPERVRHLILIAPDGLRHNFWFHFLTHSRVGNALFRWHVDHPQLFFRMIYWLEKLHFISPNYKRFLEVNMETRDKRMQVWNTWNCLRSFTPDMNLLKTYIRRYRIPVWLIFGKYDRVIKPSYGKVMTRDLREARVWELDSGHQLLSSELASFLHDQLLSRS
ncbi:MAG: alpha/beta fold hydrolase [Thermoflavifilum sp.]|nr:alpha/beta fold hydrolase [Thermoflavifilum sp.]